MTRQMLTETLDYFQKHMLPEDEVAQRAGISVDRLLELVQWRCVPPHTHEVSIGTQISGCFGDFAFPPENRRYYHPSIVEWMARVLPIAETLPLYTVAERMRDEFFDDFVAALDGRAPPWEGMSAVEGAVYAWNYVMDGTWGACLKVIDIPSMLAKEYARAVFRAVATLPDDAVLSHDQLSALEQAITDYERVAQEFAPHERPLSSRSVEYDAAKARFTTAGISPARAA